MTTRGRCLLAAGLAAALCSAVLNERDLLRVSVFVIAMPVLVNVLTARSRVGLHTQRHITPMRTPVGGRAEVSLNVWSTGRLPTGGLLLQDGVPYTLGGRPRFLVEHLPRNNAIQLRYTVEPTMRGVHHLGPLRAKVTDPFGLAEFDRELAGVNRLVVVPRVAQLLGLPGGSGLGAGDDGSVRLHSGQGEDDAVVRPYRQGDDLRKVHWRSTAHRDEMMVRVEERPWRGGTTVLLDHRESAHKGGGPTASLEWAVSMAASVCLHLHRHGHNIRLVTENGKSITPEGGDGVHSDHVVLDALASLQATHQRDIAIAGDPGHGQELLAVLGAVDPESVDQLIRYRPRSSRSLAILLDTRAWAAHGDENVTDPEKALALLTGAGWSTVVATPDMPMTQVWTNLCRASANRGAMHAGGWS
ncbi:DUF58 domain-containing protein [Actinocrispum wychmicini]|uniref:Uncharacterized protein (DUF58 family) n=1 Tax=Actinocrispum wychmicini TaxID=1213861 RepID=A0A4R2JB34_9PSEU|nr:uncharacterized protein (DUF58 family) [Actinocrispum wychmicini]